MRMQTHGGGERGRPNNNSSVSVWWTMASSSSSFIPDSRLDQYPSLRAPSAPGRLPVLIRSRNLWRTHIRDPNMRPSARPWVAPATAAAAAPLIPTEFCINFMGSLLLMRKKARKIPDNRSRGRRITIFNQAPISLFFILVYLKWYFTYKSKKIKFKAYIEKTVYFE